MKQALFLPSLSLLLQGANPICSAFQVASHITSSRVLPAKSQAWSLAATNDDDAKNPFGSFLQGLFQPSTDSVEVEPAKPKIPDCVVDSDFKLAAAFGALGVAIILTNHASGCTSNICPPSVGGAVVGGFVSLLASLFAVQATRIRFVFDEDCFELKTVDSSGSQQLSDSGENIVVGGANRWAYDTFVNWDFYPSVNLPILVYFKETQTQKPDGSNSGQIHFFPAIANCKQLEQQFELRGCAKVQKD